jgi:hypothetical protein
MVTVSMRSKRAVTDSPTVLPSDYVFALDAVETGESDLHRPVRNILYSNRTATQQEARIVGVFHDDRSIDVA